MINPDKLAGVILATATAIGGAYAFGVHSSAPESSARIITTPAATHDLPSKLIIQYIGAHGEHRSIDAYTGDITQTFDMQQQTSAQAEIRIAGVITSDTKYAFTKKIANVALVETVATVKTSLGPPQCNEDNVFIPLSFKDPGGSKEDLLIPTNRPCDPGTFQKQSNNTTLREDDSGQPTLVLSHQ